MQNGSVIRRYRAHIRYAHDTAVVMNAMVPNTIHDAHDRTPATMVPPATSNVSSVIPWLSPLHSDDAQPAATVQVQQPNQPCKDQGQRQTRSDRNVVNQSSET